MTVISLGSYKVSVGRPLTGELSGVIEVETQICFNPPGEKLQEVCFSDSSLMIYSHLAKQFYFFFSPFIYEGRGIALLQRNSYLQLGCHRHCWQLLLVEGGTCFSALQPC